MAKNQNDYHYWEGSFKGYSPKELLALSDEEIQDLFNEFINKGLDLESLYTYYKDYKKSTLNNENNNVSEITDIKKEFSTQGGGFLRYIISKILRGLKYTKDGRIKLFRSITVNEIEEIDFNELGVCWTYNSKKMSTLEIFIDHFGRIENRNYKIRFAGATSQDNIDWVISLYLYLRHTFTKYSDFDELRVIDPKKISLLGYLIIDLNSDTILSKNGDTSNILKGLNFN
jgi:hypothetical protein